MSVTLKDVKEIGAIVQSSIVLFGVDGDWECEARALFQEIGRAIMQEQGLSPEEAKHLPDDTKLGPKAEQALGELMAFIGYHA